MYILFDKTQERSPLKKNNKKKPHTLSLFQEISKVKELKQSTKYTFSNTMFHSQQKYF